MRVCIVPTYRSADQADGGIRRLVEAQQRYLPEFGWDVTDTPASADVIACHGATLVEYPGIPMVNHNHGLMWAEYNFGTWGDDVNRHIVEAMIRAQAITAPSMWVAHAITRGMLVSPEVIYHGVDADEWTTNDAHLGYVLWNKARTDPVSDPYDMNAVASLMPDVRFISTFGEPAGNVMLTGAMTHEQMKPVVQHAAVYLATTRETFGIGTLEALAAGVPVVGWRYGGQEEIVVDGETGYLADYGDYHALAECIRRALSDRDRLSHNALVDARERWGWKDRIAQYAALYTKVAKAAKAKRPKVSVVITNYNLGHYLSDALKSVDKQTMTDWECILVDDCSTDEETQRYIKLADLHEQIRYLKTPHNLGLSGARNYGWQHTNGKYIIFLDVDDMLAPNALDALSAALDRDAGTHIVFGRLDTVSADGSNRQRNPWPAADFSYDAQIAHLNQMPYASMMRREVLERSGGYRVRDWRAEDASFWSRVTSFGFRARMVTDDTVLIYRMHDAQKSRKERSEHDDGDGDWTAWLPWRIAGDPYTGLRAMQEGIKPNPLRVPWGAQGTPPPPLRAWPVHHHQHPMVSVIIPVGPGHQRYLVDVLDSVQAQTMAEWECIVINDTGETLDLTPWPWVRLWSDRLVHLGTGVARNIGLSMARAPLVLFLDADDVLVPVALETMLKAYISSDGKYIYSDWLTLKDEARIDGPMDVHEVEEYHSRKMLQGLRHAVTALIPTEWARAVGGFDEKLPVFEDWDFYCKLAVAGYCGQRAPHPLFIYRLNAGTRTKTGIQPHGADDPIEYTPLGVEAAGAITDRYAAYLSGEEPLMACCGGNPNTVADAGDALSAMVSLMTNDVIPASAALPAGKVRMEFVGAQWGAQTFHGKVSGVPYLAGRDPLNRFHDVDPRDVEHLLSTELFRVVPAAPLQWAAQAEPEPEPVSAPQWEEARPRVGRGRRR